MVENIQNKGVTNNSKVNYIKNSTTVLNHRMGDITENVYCHHVALLMVMDGTASVDDS